MNLSGRGIFLADFLGQEVEGVMAVTVDGVGEGRTDGSTRKKLVEQREKTRGLVLGKALEQHPDQRALPEWIQVFLRPLGSWLASPPGQATVHQPVSLTVPAGPAEHAVT